MQTHHNIANEKEEDGIKSNEKKKYQKPFHFENTLESPKKGV